MVPSPARLLLMWAQVSQSQGKRPRWPQPSFHKIISRQRDSNYHTQFAGLKMAMKTMSRHSRSGAGCAKGHRCEPRFPADKIFLGTWIIGTETLLGKSHYKTPLKNGIYNVKTYRYINLLVFCGHGLGGLKPVILLQVWKPQVWTQCHRACRAVLLQTF